MTSQGAVSAAPRDRGATLIEVIVGMGLFGLFGTLLLSIALSTSEVTEQTRQRTGVVEESRIAIERLARELRQASAVDAVVLPADSTVGVTSLKFWTDFDGDGLRSNDASDPEVLTYRWDPSSARLTLTAGDEGPHTTRPVISSNVSAFRLDLRSSRWAHDTNGDGTSSLAELDAAGTPVGDGDGVPDAGELAYVDLVGIEITVEDGAGSQTYKTQIDLRNRG